MRKMKIRISREELDALAEPVGLLVHRECGGYRLVKDGRDVFPDSGICPIATKRECMIFLKGVTNGLETKHAPTL